MKKQYKKKHGLITRINHSKKAVDTVRGTTNNHAVCLLEYWFKWGTNLLDDWWCFERDKKAGKANTKNALHTARGIDIPSTQKQRSLECPSFTFLCCIISVRQRDNVNVTERLIVTVIHLQFCLLSSWQTHHFITSQSAHRSSLMRDTSFRGYHCEEVLSAPIFYRSIRESIPCLTCWTIPSFPPTKNRRRQQLMTSPLYVVTDKQKDGWEEKRHDTQETTESLDVMSWCDFLRGERDHDMRVVEKHAILLNCLIPSSIPRHPRESFYRQVMQLSRRWERITHSRKD